MESLATHEVYIFKAGRKLDDDDEPATDAITAGAAALISGGSTSPLAMFNKAFNSLRQRMSVPVITGELLRRGRGAHAQPTRPPTLAPPQSTLASNSLVNGLASPPAEGSTALPTIQNQNGSPTQTADDGDNQARDWEALDALEADEDDNDELTLDDPGDVALEMDVEETLVEEEMDDDE